MTSGQAMSGMKLTLGPVFYNWPTSLWADFYARIADEAPVDRVIVGEVVCSKRTPFRIDTLVSVIERLERAGKEVAFATLALPTLRREIAEILEVARDGRLIEVNDISTLNAVAGRPHVIGPFLNIYNEDALAEVASLGAMAVCLPPELPIASIAASGGARGPVELEVFAFGRAPLAVSARCYHARAHALTKDACKYVCEQDPDGLEVDTLDGQRFLAINGIQTLASGVTVLGSEVGQLADAAVSRLRLSPHTCNMVAVARSYRDLIDGRIGARAHMEAIARIGLPGKIVNGYVHGQAGVSFAV